MKTIDKKFCMSSYMAFRYIECPDKEFYEGMEHHNFVPMPLEQRIPVHTAADIDADFKKQFAALHAQGDKLGILLSGGMDSANLAAYMPGCDAYTFRFLGGAERFNKELERAEYYAKTYNMNLHYVDINWDTVENYVDQCMKAKCAPVHSIEPQLLQAALQAKADGVTLLVIGESSDLIFGGMDQLISRDWTFDDFAKRYTFTQPADVLNEPVSMDYLYERYRKGNDIDFLAFMDDVFSIESSASYMNAFAIAGMKYYDPYARLVMADPLDLDRVRNGEPKYLIRELFAMIYPGYPIPFKIPMPRPVDEYFETWEGPKRPEFRQDIDMSKFTGDQKWQMYCLERFLNNNEPL